MAVFMLVVIGAVCLALNLLAFAYGVGHGIGYYLASFPILGIVWILAVRRLT